MESMEALKVALAETQATLSDAIAREQTYRTREQHLLEENLRLRDELKRATTAGDVHSSPSPKLDGSESSQQGRNDCTLLEEYPIVIHSKKGNVAGTLLARTGHLEIFESKAKVTSDQCVGITRVSDTSLPPRKSLGGVFSTNSKTRPWTLFGKSKTAEDVTSQSKEKTSFAATSVPVLKRNSWSGSMKAPNLDDDSLMEGETAQKNEKSFWKVSWTDGSTTEKIQHFVFEAATAMETFFARQIRKWESSSAQENTNAPVRAPSLVQKLPSFSAAGSVVPGKGMIMGRRSMELTESTALMTDVRVELLTSGIPTRHRHAKWNLLYSTERHGISLRTLLRKAESKSPTVLVIKDSADFIFGCYCSEPWKTSHRFFGTGETFVFQLEPKCVYYPWKQKSSIPNNFFMFASSESLSVGGTGHFALWLDSELLIGRSGMCDTFGSPCIASKEEFKISSVELWELA